MIQKIKIALVSLALTLGATAPALVPAVASAAESNTITKGICQGSNDAANNGAGGTDCSTGGTNANDSLRRLANQIVNIFSIIVGIAAVIMIIYGGFRYITSGGDSGRVGNAKNTLIYAIIGLVIVALAQFLVRYVFTTATNITT